MKKYCLVALLVLCFALCLTGCGDKNEVVEVPVVTDEPIESLFASTFEANPIEAYDFVLLFESTQNFNVYEISNRLIEKKNVTYTYNDIEYMKPSTAEYDPFDFFVYKDGEFFSLWDLVSRNRLGFGEVKHIVDEWHDWEVDFGPTEDEIWAENLIYGLQNKNLLPYQGYINSTLGITVSAFNLKETDFEWTVFNTDDVSGYLDCIFVAKYETEAQRLALMDGIEFYKAKTDDVMFPDNIKENIRNHQRTYELKDRKMIIFFSSMNVMDGAYEYIESYIAGENNQ